jgi:hypothetical protein
MNMFRLVQFAAKPSLREKLISAAAPEGGIAMPLADAFGISAGPLAGTENNYEKYSQKISSANNDWSLS